MRKSVHDGRPPLKYRLPRARSGSDPVKLLHDQGYLAHPPVEHEDTWFERKEGAMLGSIVLRHNLATDTWTMAWETTIRTGEAAEKHHLWTPVEGAAMWDRLERLGFRPVMGIRATRIPLSKGAQHIALERVKRMGDFLEVPGVGREGHLRQEVHDLLHRLGATGPETRTYREIMDATVKPTA